MHSLGLLLRRASTTSVFWLSGALLAIVICFGIITPAGTFLTGFNAQTVAADSSVLLILATALTLVIISGGLDLSVGSVMTFCAVIGVVVMRSFDGGEWAAVAVGGGVALLCGAGWGAINGLLIAYLRIPAFVVTLGTLGAALGAARLISDGSAQTGAPPVLQSDIGFSRVLEIPTPFLIGIGVAALFGLIMGLTRFGERVHLVGSNEEATRRGGVATRWLQFRIYVLAGSLAGFAGLVDLARFNSAGVSTGHITELLAALAAVIIGGASLFGGTGLIIGSVVGVFIPVILNNGFVILGVRPFWQEIVVAAILVAAVGLDQVRRRAALHRPIPADRGSEKPASKAGEFDRSPLPDGVPQPTQKENA